MYSFDRSHVQHFASPLPRRQDSSALTSAAFNDPLNVPASNGAGRPLRKTVVPWRVSVARSGSKGTPARPAAETIRPQLGSLPCMAHFTSGELAMARAMARASEADAAASAVTATALG